MNEPQLDLEHQDRLDYAKTDCKFTRAIEKALDKHLPRGEVIDIQPTQDVSPVKRLEN